MTRRFRFSAFLPLLSIVLLLNGCANYASRVAEPRHRFENGEYDAAIEDLKKLVARHDNDQLLYVLDLATVYHTAGRYQEAIQTFRDADKLAEIKDYTSIAAETASFLFNDTMKDYKGELFEKLLINVYLAIDYTMLGQWDDALVECRRVNHKIDMMIDQGKLKYDHNPFAKYLSAALFEARHEYNDAFVDYRTVAKWADSFPYLPKPLLRMADKLQDLEELDDYRKEFPKTKNYRLGSNEGEVILLLEQGRAPYKIPNPSFNLLPMFVRNTYYSDYVWIRDAVGKNKVRSYPLFDIEATAIKELDDQTAGIIAKKTGGIIAKEAMAYGVAKATDSELAGFLTSLFLHATDQADLRSWTTLPARLQIARMSLPAGRHDIVLDMVSTASDANGIKRWPGVEVKAGEQTFLNYRTPD